MDAPRLQADDESMSPGTRGRSLDEMLAQARARIRRREPRDAYEAAQRGAFIVDIRCPGDIARDGAIPGSLHIPRTVLEWRLAPDSAWRSPCAPDLDREILVVCDHGYSSGFAADALRQLGFAHVGDVAGGFEAWRAAGLPTADGHDLPARPAVSRSSRMRRRRRTRARG